MRRFRNRLFAPITSQSSHEDRDIEGKTSNYWTNETSHSYTHQLCVSSHRIAFRRYSQDASSMNPVACYRLLWQKWAAFCSGYPHIKEIRSYLQRFLHFIGCKTGKECAQFSINVAHSACHEDDVLTADDRKTLTQLPSGRIHLLVPRLVSGFFFF